MSEELKTNVRKIFDEAYNQGKLEIIDDLVADDYVRKQPPMKSVKGLDAYKKFITQIREAYSNLKISLDEVLADGDKTVARITLTGKHTGRTPTLHAPPTGKEISMVGCVVSTWKDGKLVEDFAYNDYMGLTQQFGVVPLQMASWE